MKKLLTRLLLLMVGLFCTAQMASAAKYYITGDANAMSSSSVHGWNIPAAELETDSNGDILFWVSGQFAISKSQGNSAASDDNGKWSPFNSARFVIKYENSQFTADFNWKDTNTNTGNSSNKWADWKNNVSKYYVKLHHNGDNNATVTVQDTPFEVESGPANVGKTLKLAKYNSSNSNWGNDSFTDNGDGSYSLTGVTMYASDNYYYVTLGSTNYGPADATSNPKNGKYAAVVNSKFGFTSDQPSTATIKAYLNEAGTAIDYIEFSGLNTGTLQAKTPPTALWVGGDLVGSSWTTAMVCSQLSNSENDKIFTGTIETSKNDAWFCFFTENGKDKDSNKYRVDSPTSNVTPAINAVDATSLSKYDVAYSDGAGHSWKIASQGKYDVTVDFTDAENAKMWITEHETVTPPTPTGDFTIYFFDKTGEFSTGSGKTDRECKTDVTMMVHLWDTKGFYSWNSDNEKMTPLAGKYVLIDGTYYPVWSYTFSAIDGRTPTDLKLYYRNESNQVKEPFNEMKFANGAFYSVNGASTQTLVEKGLIDFEKKTIYFHAKADAIRYHEYKPVDCDVEVAIYQSSKGSDNWGSHYGDLDQGSNNQYAVVKWTKMILLNKEYQVYGANIEPKNGYYSGADYNVVFRYKTNTGAYEYWDSWYRRVDNGGDDWNTTRGRDYLNKDTDVTAFIWTTADTHFGNTTQKGAIQSYATYKQFEDANAQGEKKIYIVGRADNNPNQGDKWAICVYDNNDLDTEKRLNWNVDGANINVIEPYALDKETFYFKMKACGGDLDEDKFKISFMNVNAVKAAHENLGTVGADNQRAWATYDLGAIGVDTQKVNDEIAQPHANNDGNHGGNRTDVNDNCIIPMASFNQYDWKFGNHSGWDKNSEHWVVVDMHPGCRTVSFLKFNPNPSAKITTDKASAVETPLADDDFNEMWFDQHISACEHNGHVEYRNVNEVLNKVSYTPSAGVKDAGFALNYRIQDTDGNELVGYQEEFLQPSYFNDNTTADYEVVCAPQSNAKKYNTLCWYHDNTTGFNSHSKLGSATGGESSVTFNAPQDPNMQAKWVFRMDKAADGKTDMIHLGMLITGLENFTVNTQGLNVFADYSVKMKADQAMKAYIVSEEAEEYDGVKIPDTNMENATGSLAQTISALKDARQHYGCFVNNNSFNENIEDHPEKWSYYIAANPEKHKVAVFVPIIYCEYHQGYDYVKWLEDNYGRNVTVDYTAIYPFAVPSNRRVSAASVANAPMRITDKYATSEIELSRQTNVLYAAVDGDDISTGLNSIVIDGVSEAPVYYNLQGVKVEKPGKGLYIEVRGKESKKVQF